ncbi:glycosyltransferase [Bradymonas sediminis]|uniref:Uncharacterized protein n=1 Tax=Bradymonas sediminis TaxID=1548548 RepID=A0A2Z4FQD8_9DELT|nr:glycosyltransferase [Bradymonas sediminis]AWV91140.1 hypothetical protein DN745_18130 [Bradymonas sediminis]TDP73699.1 glycosyl transferase family 1 [Bradymonas sediminis]
MKVLIYETGYAGHHLEYVNSLVKGLNRCGVEPLLVTSSEAVSSAEFRFRLSDESLHFRLDDSMSTTTVVSPVRTAIKKLWHLLGGISRHQPAHVYIPYIDGLIYLIGGLGDLAKGVIPEGTQIEGILFNANFAWTQTPKAADQLRLYLIEEALRSGLITRLHLLDEFVAEFIRERVAPSLSHRISILHDPAPSAQPLVTSHQARQKLGLPQDGALVLVTGVLTARKGVTQILQAMSQINNPRLKLVLAGKPDSEICALLQTPQANRLRERGRLIERLRFVEGAEFPLYFSASDLVSACYSDHLGSSGIVLNAARARRPLIGTNQGWIGKTIEKYGLGITCEVSDLDSIKRALNYMCAESFAFPSSSRRGEFLSKHRLEHFEDDLTRGARERSFALK